MSTLQLSLAIIGGLVLALIVAYNTWTSRRNAPKRAQPVEHDRVAEPHARHEPGFEGAVPVIGDPASALQGMAPGSEPLVHGDDLAHAPSPVHHGDTGPMAHRVDPDDALQLPVPPVQERRMGLDPLIDVIAQLHADHNVSGEAALAARPPTRRAGTKPFAIEGFNEPQQQWETPVAGMHYRNFQTGVQLANRVGALNEIEFSEFVVKTQAFADAINAAPDFPDMLQEVARARELDQFASDHDAQLTFMLRARQAAWSPGYVQQNAARLGFVSLSMPGRMSLAAVGAGSGALCTLAFDTQAALAEDPDQSAIRELWLSLDVPQVDRREEPFLRLCEVAMDLCQSMEGVLCDQNGQPLPTMALEPIAADLELLYDQLDARDLSAGSALARRLFS